MDKKKKKKELLFHAVRMKVGGTGWQGRGRSQELGRDAQQCLAMKTSLHVIH